MLKALAILLVCAATLFVEIWRIGYSSCNQPPKEHSESAQQQQANKYDCSAVYPTFKLGLAEIWRLAHEYHEELIAIGTIFIAIFTIILGTFTVSLASATQELVREARQTGERQLRAYVGIMDHTITNISDGQKPKIGLVINNFGLTPALEVQYWVTSVFGSNPLANKLPVCEFVQKGSYFSLLTKLRLLLNWISH
jgi:hypothetical protein